jgi:hypothetical protein
VVVIRNLLRHPFLRGALTLIAFTFTGAVMATEEPKYTVLEKEPPFEIRAYAQMIVAEVQVREI